VLVVEDEETVRRLVKRVLAEKGYTVLTAGTVDEAISTAAAQERPVDLVLTDIVMPSGDGFEVAEQLTDGRPETRVLFMSGRVTNKLVGGDVAEGLGFLQKPFTAATLARRVRETLDGAAR
jgi:DNA-binding response OmpR family regulator